MTSLPLFALKQTGQSQQAVCIERVAGESNEPRNWTIAATAFRHQSYIADTATSGHKGRTCPDLSSSAQRACNVYTPLRTAQAGSNLWMGACKLTDHQPRLEYYITLAYYIIKDMEVHWTFYKQVDIDDRRRVIGVQITNTYLVNRNVASVTTRHRPTGGMSLFAWFSGIIVIVVFIYTTSTHIQYKHISITYAVLQRTCIQ